MKLTRDVLPWPDGWGIVQDPEKPNYPGMLNCYSTDGAQQVPIGCDDYGLAFLSLNFRKDTRPSRMLCFLRSFTFSWRFTWKYYKKQHWNLS